MIKILYFDRKRKLKEVGNNLNGRVFLETLEFISDQGKGTVNVFL